MKRTILAAAAAVSFCLSGAAYAKTTPIITIWYPQQTALPAYTTATVIQDFSAAVGANGTPYEPQTVPGLFSEEVKIQGQNKRVTLYNTDPLTGQPKNGMDGNYIGLVNGADYVINFLNGGVQFFSFVFNNLGTNDKLTLYFSDGTSVYYTAKDILNGAEIIGGQTPADIPGQPDDWGRVVYDMLGGPNLISADFHSGSSEWFIDSIAWAVPEPGTWAMMILGFGMAGWQLRKRRRAKGALATA